MRDVFASGAALYTPATHRDLGRLFIGSAVPGLGTTIACTEDAIRDDELEAALDLLQDVLHRLPAGTQGPLRYVRPRNPDVLKRLLAMPGIEKVDGFVLPKADAQSLPTYLELLDQTSHAFMPTIETESAFSASAMLDLRALLCRARVRERCAAVRIGGNDLLRILGMRRPAECTLYDTPIGALIPQLVMTFKPMGFRMTGSVLDRLDGPDLLSREAALDRRMGLDGKSAVHPAQVELIDGAFRITAQELHAATALLDPSAPAVFRMAGVMQEPAVHRAWANAVLRTHRERACISGVGDMQRLAPLGEASG